GAGFIGSHIVDRLVSDGCRVKVLDDLSTGSLRNIEGHLNREGFQFMEGNITEQSTLRKALEGVEVVFHEAALASIPDSMEDPVRTNEVNTTGTLKLIKASIECGVHRLIFASSSSIYGDRARPVRIKEDSTLNPVSPYAVSKLAAEQYCLTFTKLGKLEAVSLRYFNVYGPRQRYGPYSGVITIYHDLIRKNQPPIIYGDGEQTRDFVNVKDVVAANILAMTVRNASGEAFNIGTGHSTSIHKLAEMFTQAGENKRLRPLGAPRRPGDVRHSCADIQKARRILGYSPSASLKEYINELVLRNGSSAKRAILGKPVERKSTANYPRSVK
ncbi:MAG: NAD-dependent epimerase/dehydratase family protein, partial [archaeon]